MFGFSSKKTPKETYETVITPLRKCHCGAESYRGTGLDDVISCQECGTLYFIYARNPVAKREMKKVD